MAQPPGKFECQEYSIGVAGRPLRLLGPKYPHALNDDPEARRRSEDDGYKPYWAQPCPAAVMLAEYVIEHVKPSEEPVLELGAGLGIVGLSLSTAGHRVVVTDYDADALAFAQASARLNGVEFHEVRLLDWRNPPPERYRLIVASDVVYERRSLHPIAALLAACLMPAGQAFFSDLNRTTADEFPDALRAAGLTFDTVPANAKAIPAFDAVDGRVFSGRIFRILNRLP
jgi:predicted nicotinamide N-methyase